MNENSDIIKRKIMGLWYPPFECAYIKVNEEKFYFITKEILEEISILYEQSNREKMTKNKRVGGG